MHIVDSKVGHGPFLRVLAWTMHAWDRSPAALQHMHVQCHVLTALLSYLMSWEGVVGLSSRTGGSPNGLFVYSNWPLERGVSRVNCVGDSNFTVRGVPGKDLAGVPGTAIDRFFDGEDLVSSFRSCQACFTALMAAIR